MTERAIDHVPAKDPAMQVHHRGRTAFAGKTASGEPEPLPISRTLEGAVEEQAAPDAASARERSTTTAAG